MTRFLGTAARRRWAIAGAALLLYLGLSIRHVPAGGEVAVRDSAFLKTQPRVLPPGWHFVPRGVLSIYRYPDGEQQLDLLLDAAHGRGLQARDGSPVGAEVSVTYRLELAQVLEIHGRHGSAYEEAWLIDELVAEAREWMERNTYEEVAGANRVRLERALEAKLGAGWRDAGIDLDRIQVWRVAAGDLSPSLTRAELRPLRSARMLFIGIDSADSVADVLLPGDVTRRNPP